MRHRSSTASATRSALVAVAHAIPLILLLGGCALPSTEPSPPGAAPAPADAGAMQEPRYLRYRPEETGLVAVHDDGRDTYLEFAHPVPRSTTAHDHDGRLLPTVASGVVVALPGLHAGILVRQADRASFAAPNPRRRHDLTLPLPDRPDFIDARARLQGGGPLQAAMARALSAAGAAQPATPPGALVIANTTSPPVASVATAVAPLTTANLMAAQPEQGLLRVFFASASRAIVAPDDGLATLLREAPRADRIRVTGYTDAVGSRASNLALARQRADAVAEILIRRGVSPARIEVGAIAADDYLADNETDRGRALNRRAEILLLRDGRPLRFSAAR